MKQWSHHAARLEPPLDSAAKNYIRAWEAWMLDPYRGVRPESYYWRRRALRHLLENAA
jgi:hypothetical protein